MERQHSTIYQFISFFLFGLCVSSSAFADDVSRSIARVERCAELSDAAHTRCYRRASQRLAVDIEAVKKKKKKKKKKNKANTNSKKKKKSKCNPPLGNLIVVNFSSSKIQAVVGGETVGQVEPQSQKLINKVLPVGENAVEIIFLDGSQEPLQIVTLLADEGKKTCKRSVAVRVPAAS